VRSRKLKKKLKNLSEITANNSNSNIRKYVLEQVSKTNCVIFSIVISKKKVKPVLYASKNKLYNYLTGLLFNYISLNTKKLEIIIDKKDSNKLLGLDFNNYVLKKIKSKNPKIKASIIHLDSTASK